MYFLQQTQVFLLNDNVGGDQTVNFSIEHLSPLELFSLFTFIYTFFPYASKLWLGNKGSNGYIFTIVLDFCIVYCFFNSTFFSFAWACV